MQPEAEDYGGRATATLHRPGIGRRAPRIVALLGEAGGTMRRKELFVALAVDGLLPDNRSGGELLRQALRCLRDEGSIRFDRETVELLKEKA